MKPGEITAEVQHSKFEGKADGGAVKMSQAVNYKKVPVSLVPLSLILGTGRALHYGATKYEANQWRRGLPWSQLVDAIIRHAGEIADGYLYDSESGLFHADHLGANVAFLSEFLAKPEYAAFNNLPPRDQKYPDATAVLQELAARKAAKAA